MQKKIIIGNQKMYKTHLEVKKFLTELKPLIKKKNKEIYLAPSFTSIQTALEVSENILIGSQNIAQEEEGAFTGEISIKMLKALNAHFAIIGHSERRTIFKETDESINKKILTCLKNNFKSVFCIGETLLEYEQNKTKEVLLSQISKGLKNVLAKDMKNVIIAYEPVWAIGTGKSATPELVEEIHFEIKEIVKKLFDKSVSDKLSVLYGGSVNSSNIEDLLKKENIDGALIGKASLDPNQFAEIINKG